MSKGEIVYITDELFIQKRNIFLAIQVERSCCHPAEFSSACPLGADFQVEINDVYTKYFTRCKADLCNDGPGDNSEDADNGGKFL